RYRRVLGGAKFATFAPSALACRAGRSESAGGKDVMTSTAPSDTLAALGLDRAPAVHRNDTAPRLYEETIRRGTGRLTAHGALNVDTTPYTGRSPKDKLVVRDASTEGPVAWGSVNQPFDPQRYEALATRVREHLASR